MPNKADLSDAEEALIQQQIASDPDAPELTPEQLAQGKPFTEVFPKLAAAIRKGRGRPRVAAPKEAVTLRITPETLARFQAKGGDWRALMSATLENAKP